MKQYGFVYLLGNECMPNLYKIGCTERSPHMRAAQLSEPTGVPAPFDVLCYIEVEDHQQTERNLHQHLDWARVTSRREFFRFDDFGLLVGYFRWHPCALAFTDCGASARLPDGVSVHASPDPWVNTLRVDLDDDFPFDRSVQLKVVKGGEVA